MQNSNVNNQYSKKYDKQKKGKYSFNQNDNINNKIYLNQFYEDEFNSSNNVKNRNDNRKVNINMNNDNILYKDNSTTNHSTYSNGSLKIKNLKKSIIAIKKNNNSNDEKIENLEDLHFFIVSSLQNGKKYAKKFH